MQQNGNSMTASLTLQGSACNAFGYDIKDLQLMVEYQSANRLHVHIQDAANTQWQIPNDIWPRPGSDLSLDASTTDLEFHYDSMPFAFWITRRSSGEVLFDTRAASIPTYSDRVYQNNQFYNGTEMPAHPLVFEDQYLQISSALPTGANVFGNGEVIAASGIRRNASSSLTTLFAADIGVSRRVRLPAKERSLTMPSPPGPDRRQRVRHASLLPGDPQHRHPRCLPPQQPRHGHSPA